jgi:hypothetical protein
MAKLLSEKDKSLIIADFKTGQYSQRQLAKKHNVSSGTVNGLTKNLDTSNEHLVNAQIAILSAKDNLPDEQMNAVMNAALVKAKREGLIFGNAEKLASKINIMTDQAESPMEIKTLSEANMTLGKSLGVIEQFAKSGDVNVQTNTAVNNNSIKIEYAD